MSRMKQILVGVLAAVLVVGCGVQPSSVSAPQPVAGIDSATLRVAITKASLTKHLDALQGIADQNNGTRASGTPGYAASLDYVEAQLKQAGLTTQRQEFTYLRGDEEVTTCGNDILIWPHRDGPFWPRV